MTIYSCSIFLVYQAAFFPLVRRSYFCVAAKITSCFPFFLFAS
uniref:Uncharacterized protein n=1 Tax=Arundo donax TaxID=35708 RepID=A0A0A9AMG1_ARUDO